MSDIPIDNSKNHECANENPKDINFSKRFQEFCEIIKTCSRFVLYIKRRATKILSLSLGNPMFTIECTSSLIEDI